jgi:hypothetical protein
VSEGGTGWGIGLVQVRVRARVRVRVRVRARARVRARVRAILWFVFTWMASTEEVAPPITNTTKEVSDVQRQEIPASSKAD